MTLSQEEVAFLLGVNGEYRAIKASRDENTVREPNLRAALAYEAIYDRPVRELFAGLYEEVEREVAMRARILGHRTVTRPRPRLQEVIARLVSKISA